MVSLEEIETMVVRHSYSISHRLALRVLNRRLQQRLAKHSNKKIHTLIRASSYIYYLDSVTFVDIKVYFYLICITQGADRIIGTDLYAD